MGIPPWPPLCGQPAAAGLRASQKEFSMSRRPHGPPPALHNYTPDIDGLQLRLTAFMLHWQGVAPTPPSLTEAVEELRTTVEELQVMNEDLTASQQTAIEHQRRYQE